jgi:hypothetical protein
MKQTKAHEMRLTWPQNGVKLNPKPTPRNKMNRSREKYKKGIYLQRKNNLDNMGNEASRRVSTFDMP